jgi:hypothetical protein
MAQLILMNIKLNRSEVFDGGEDLRICHIWDEDSVMLYRNICVRNQMTVDGNLRVCLLFAYVLY